VDGRTVRDVRHAAHHLRSLAGCGWPDGPAANRNAPVGEAVGSAAGGFGLGTTGTSALFLTAILALVGFLTVTQVDRAEVVRADEEQEALAA
jgi:hypothetical protein